MEAGSYDSKAVCDHLRYFCGHRLEILNGQNSKLHRTYHVVFSFVFDFEIVVLLVLDSWL